MQILVLGDVQQKGATLEHEIYKDEAFVGAAPIALFAYNRPEHLRLTVEALRRNVLADVSDLYVFCDGARDASVEASVAEVRAFARSIDGFRSVTLFERQANYGLARSIIDGVTSICSKYARVIVLEDDIVTSPVFLRFMNEGLSFYQAEARVASIHGYSYPVGERLPETFFLRGADCWGWATWARAWRAFEPDGAKLLSGLREAGLISEFDLGGAFAYTAMLEDQIAGRNDSWAVRWHASCFLRNMLTLYPGRSLVQNIGNDATGAHCGNTDDYLAELSTEAVRVGGIALVGSETGRQAFARFLLSATGKGLGSRLVRFWRRVGFAK